MIERHSPLKQRMYFLTNMYFAGIHAGIQAGHAALKYAHWYGHNPDYADFIVHDQTWIILVGGFSNDHESVTDPAWGMNYALDQLKKNNIDCAEFRETMANRCLSAIAFLVNERVWDKVKYPEPVGMLPGIPFEVAVQLYKEMGLSSSEAFLRQFLKPYPLAK